MITISQAAARQIRRTADSSHMEELALRIAASRNPDGSIGYRMGFDEIGPDDVIVNARGVDVVLRTDDKALLNGMTLDFVELEPGNFQFIFLNPNDPSYRPPSELA
jgi:iron-sulfur cluster assembly protein